LPRLEIQFLFARARAEILAKKIAKKKRLKSAKTVRINIQVN